MYLVFIIISYSCGLSNIVVWADNLTRGLTACVSGKGGNWQKSPTGEPAFGAESLKGRRSPPLSACTLCWARNEDTLIFKDLTQFYNSSGFLFQSKLKLSQPGFGPRLTRRQATIPDSLANSAAKAEPANFGDLNCLPGTRPTRASQRFKMKANRNKSKTLTISSQPDADKPNL